MFTRAFAARCDVGGLGAVKITQPYVRKYREQEKDSIVVDLPPPWLLLMKTKDGELQLDILE